MADYDKTITRLRLLPEPLIQEVSDFIDFLLLKHNIDYWQYWQHFSDSLQLAEKDFSDYSGNLEDYEEKLAEGEIKW